MYTEILDELTKLKQEYRIKGEESLKKAFKMFFESEPETKAVVWSQLIPFWADGEECVFRVNDVYFTNATDEQLANVSHFGEYEGPSNDGVVVDHIPSKAQRDLEDFLQSDEMDTIMQDVFGQHAIVKATTDGFMIEEYNDHD